LLRRQDPLLPICLNGPNVVETSCNDNSEVLPGDGDHGRNCNISGTSLLLEAKNIFGPALLQAIREGRETLAIELVEKGADPNAKDSYGFALTQAIRGGYEILAIELVERGADPNAKDSYGFALTQAKSGGLAKLERVLLERGAKAPAMTQKSSGTGQITINGFLPPGTDPRVSTAGGFIQIIGSRHHATVVRNVSAFTINKSASSGSIQILGSDLLTACRVQKDGVID
jgi:hypothetical protein